MQLTCFQFSFSWPCMKDSKRLAFRPASIWEHSTRTAFSITSTFSVRLFAFLTCAVRDSPF
jgi:hypothetical protein